MPTKLTYQPTKTNIAFQQAILATWSSLPQENKDTITASFAPLLASIRDHYGYTIGPLTAVELYGKVAAWMVDHDEEFDLFRHLPKETR